MCSPRAGRRLLPLLAVVAAAATVTLALPSSGPQSHRIHSDWSLHDDEYVLAYINVTYTDPVSGAVIHQGGEIGKFSTGLVASARGRLVHVRSRNGTAHHGCDGRYENDLPPAPQPWVALVRRGLCNFDVKVENAYRNNASAVLIYDYKEGELHRIHLTQRHKDTIVTVFIPKTQGEDLAHITDSGVDVSMQITPGKHFRYADNNLNKTSVLFVSVSFILLMVISLAWLLFYYVQRFRYIHARDQLTKRLVCAAKKAVCRIPVRILKADDAQLAEGECCAVCLEPYRVSDHLRALPCSHEFHKQCVDPWLLKNRTCPMCKMDILKYFGLSSVSEESIVHLELEGVSVAQRRGSPLSPVLYVSSQPAGAVPGTRSRTVSRASLQSMSLVMPSPACVESLHGHGPTAARCRRVSAALAAGRRQEPPRRASAPTQSPGGGGGREALARSLSTPTGPAAGTVGVGSLVTNAYEVIALPCSSGPIETAMRRRCQRLGRADTSYTPQDSSESFETTVLDQPAAAAASPVPVNQQHDESPTEATPADSDTSASSEKPQQHADVVCHVEEALNDEKVD
ncbi:RING finger protein 150-like isoform X2 [Amphibalanus amphitrite]|uniref:RING finger protein 150-like isoform X2 n=1 Tax=Amphibalanus amphitrite TaxID=1232801 RepID=UPI001C91BB34|nr:RING finger protein 150-like isoform X2 [Amphibalanus amphitrite]